MILERLFNWLKKKLLPKGGLAERTVKSGIWATLINLFDRGLQLFKLLILARILSPAAFGLMGIALLTLTVLNQMSRLGFKTALIQRVDENVDEYLNTVLVMQVTRGLVIAAIAYLGAPYVAQFFSEPRAEALIQVLALSPILTGLQNPGVLYLKKNLEFHKQFAFKMGRALTSAIVTLAFAYVYRNVWALVFGRLAGDLVALVISYLIHGYRPQVEFDRKFAEELFDYGKWITGSGVLIFLFDHGDDAFIGWLLSASALGYYQIAYRFSNAPATEVGYTLASVMFPMYSKVQDDIDRLRNGFFRTLQISSLVTFPMAIGIIIAAPSFVSVFMGSDWMPIVRVMQILAVWGLVHSILNMASPLFQAVGHPEYNTFNYVIRLVFVVLLIYPATNRWGIEGTAMVIVGSACLQVPVVLYLVQRQLETDVTTIFYKILPPAIGSAIMGAVTLYVRDLHLVGGAFEFVTIVTTGVVVYTTVIGLMEHWFDFGLRNNINVLVTAVQ
jgi:PST family polysaccharide transporter/lipopolysaccharide exporter